MSDRSLNGDDLNRQDGGGFHPATGDDLAVLSARVRTRSTGLGSPTFPLPPETYTAYCSTYQWKEIYGRELLYSGPLFTHQLSHLWIDFRGIRDAFMREHGSDYFENSSASFVDGWL